MPMIAGVAAPTRPGWPTIPISIKVTRANANRNTLNVHRGRPECLLRSRYRNAAATALTAHAGVITAYLSCGTKAIPRGCEADSTATTAITIRGTETAHAAHRVRRIIGRVHSNGVVARPAVCIFM